MEESFEDAIARIARAYVEGPPSFSPGSMAAGSAAEDRGRERWIVNLLAEAETVGRRETGTGEGRALLATIVSDLRARRRTQGEGDVQIAQNVVLVGPFSDGSHRLVVEGFEVPHVRVRRGTHTLGDFRSQPDPSGYDVILDDRLSFNVPKDRAEQTFLLLANGMAIAAGFSCFGPNRRKLDAFGVRVAGYRPDPEQAPENASPKESN